MTYRRTVRPLMAPSDRAHTLPDGTVLHSPEPRQARDLRIGWWVKVNDEPWRIVDLRFRNGDGKVVHLKGGRPLTLNAHDTVPVYVMRPPATRAAGRR